MLACEKMVLKQIISQTKDKQRLEKVRDLCSHSPKDRFIHCVYRVLRALPLKVNKMVQ